MDQPTAFSRIHPYPAMVADGLADSICQDHVRRGMRVLDPFCGTGRLVVSSATYGATALGIDVNPLAVLISRAKRPLRSSGRFLELMAEIQRATPWPFVDCDLDLEAGRDVTWFSARIRRELASLIYLINNAPLTHDEALACAAVLSATSREVSYARQDQWKLHRISAERRARHSRSTRGVFLRRAMEFLRESDRRPPASGTADFILGNSKSPELLRGTQWGATKFDLVLTSPPYGDSRTTVQYGAMSSLSLGVVRHIAKVSAHFLRGGEIDREALGGVMGERARSDLRGFWKGSAQRPEARRVSSFLDDFQSVLEQVARVTAPDGKAIFIVGRRSVGGWRLHLDRFVTETLTGSGFRLMRIAERTLRGKTTPTMVNRSARSHRKARASDQVLTMKTEFVLVLQRMGARAKGRTLVRESVRQAV